MPAEGEKLQTTWSARLWEKYMLFRVSVDHEIDVKDEELAECRLDLYISLIVTGCDMLYTAN